MNIGLIVYSWSGHTKEVAAELRERLAAKGHDATLVEIPLKAERRQGDRDFEIASMPDLSAYDALVFGAAVEAFSLSPVMTAYLKGVNSLQGKRAACLVSQQFPYAWLGGNRAIRQMKKLLRANGAAIVGSAVVHWAQSKREASLVAAVDRISGLF